MKKLIRLSTELLSFVLVGFLVGRFLDKTFFLEGWATLFCLIVVYILWFLKFYKASRSD